MTHQRIAEGTLKNWLEMWAEFQSRILLVIREFDSQCEQNSDSQTVEKTDDRLIFGQKSLRTTIQTKSCALKILLIISCSSDRSQNNINAALRH